MNLHVSDMTHTPTREEAEEALALLKAYAESAEEGAVSELDPGVAAMFAGRDYPVLSREYPEGFEVDAAYKDSLPDLQNGPSSLIKGAKRQIQHVGISNFRLPIRFHTRDNGDHFA